MYAVEPKLKAGNILIVPQKGFKTISVPLSIPMPIKNLHRKVMKNAHMMLETYSEAGSAYLLKIECLPRLTRELEKTNLVVWEGKSKTMDSLWSSLKSSGWPVIGSRDSIYT